MPSVVSQSSSTEVTLRSSSPPKAFELDAVFGPRSTQVQHRPHCHLGHGSQGVDGCAGLL